jgi:hypothetical protein
VLGDAALEGDGAHFVGLAFGGAHGGSFCSSDLSAACRRMRRKSQRKMAGDRKGRHLGDRKGRHLGDRKGRHLGDRNAAPGCAAASGVYIFSVGGSWLE